MVVGKSGKKFLKGRNYGEGNAGIINHCGQLYKNKKFKLKRGANIANFRDDN